MNKNQIHKEIIAKMIYSKDKVKQMSIADLLIIKEAVDKELENRGY